MLHFTASISLLINNSRVFTDATIVNFNLKMSSQEMSEASTEEAKHEGSAASIITVVNNASSSPSDSSLPLPPLTADLKGDNANNNPLMSCFSDGGEECS